jgi:hypothetical protein
MPREIDVRLLHARVLPLMEHFIIAAKKFELDPLLLGAVCDHETLCGQSKLLRSKTGDWTPRPTGGRYELGPRYRPEKAKRFDRAKQAWLECEGVMPKDGLGWGRWLMQVDYGSFFEWLQSHDWRDDLTNIMKGAEILRGKLDYCRGSLLAAIAAYNCGEGVARTELDRQQAMPGGVSDEQLIAALDRHTTGGDYVADVLYRYRLLDSPTPGAS